MQQAHRRNGQKSCSLRLYLFYYFIFLQNKGIMAHRNAINNRYNMKLKNLLATMAAALLICACSTPTDVVYMQDLENNALVAAANAKAITLQTGDQLSVVVNSKNAELATLFNLPYYSSRIGDVKAGTREASLGSSNSQGISAYTVDSNGEIDFPIIGAIKVAGLTREEVASTIKQKLLASGQINDAVVTVEFLNIVCSVMGEVNTPGRIAINRDKYTLLDAISAAGDLTINGRRKDVMVLRQTPEGQQVYKVDLTNGAQLFSSPAFYLQQNDMVYVSPNDKRQREATINGNNLRSTSFWISLASLLTSVAVLIFK